MPRYSTSLLFLFILIVGHGQALANNQDSNAKIKEKVNRFISKVFGEKPPTLADYYRYENIHSEWEGVEEDKYCIARWGGIQTEGCKAWLIDRSNNLNKSESLFYKHVRKLIQLKPKQVTAIEVICDESKSGNYCKSEVFYGSIGTSLSLKLVNDPRIPDLAYLRISKIDGKPIAQYFK